MVNNHYSIDDTTDLTAYFLEHYGEVKDIADCHLTYTRITSITIKTKQETDLLKHFNCPKHLNSSKYSILRPISIIRISDIRKQGLDLKKNINPLFSYAMCFKISA